MSDEYPDRASGHQPGEWRVRYAGLQGDQTPLRAVTDRCTDVVQGMRRRARADDFDLPAEYRGSDRLLLAAAGASADGNALVDESPLATITDEITERRGVTAAQAPDAGAVAEVLAARSNFDSIVLLTANDEQLVALADGLEAARLDVPHRVLALDPESPSAADDAVDTFSAATYPALLLGSVSSLPTHRPLPLTALVLAGSVEEMPVPAALVGLVEASALQRCPTEFVIGIPHTVEARLPSEDGRALLETAAQLRSAAFRSGRAIRFTAESRAVTDAIAGLATDGAEVLHELEVVGVDGHHTAGSADDSLRSLLDEVTDSRQRADLLRRWQPPSGGETSASGLPENGGQVSAIDRVEGRGTPSETAIGLLDRIRAWLSNPRGGGVAASPAPTGDPFDSPATYPDEPGEDARVALLSRDPYRSRAGTVTRFRRDLAAGMFVAPVRVLRALGRDLPDPVAERFVESLRRESMLVELRRLAGALDGIPSPHDADRFGAYPPAEYVREYRTWTGTVAAAGIDTSALDEITDHPFATDDDDDTPVAGIRRAPLVEELVEFAEVLGTVPAPIDIRNFGAYPPQAYLRVFGSWFEAIEEAELDDGPAPPGTEGPEGEEPAPVGVGPVADRSSAGGGDLVAELRELADRLGGPPSRRDVRTFGEHPPERYEREFGSWADALDAAGLDPGDVAAAAPSAEDEVAPFREASASAVEGALVAELGQLAAIIGGPPTREDVKKFGDYPPHRYVEAFGSWAAALDRAGFDVAEESQAEPDGVTDRVIGAVRALSGR